MSLRDVRAALVDREKVSLIHQPTQKTVQDLRLVPASDEHKGFILSTWITHACAIARKSGVRREFYMPAETAIAESRWRDCKVATDDDGFTVYAWACGDLDGTLWNVYVVPELRRLGLASCLITASCGELKAYARRWPFMAHAPLNPYANCIKVTDGR